MRRYERMGGRPIEPLIKAIANASPARREHLHAVIDRTVANHDRGEDHLDPESTAWARVLHENLDARVDGTLDADAVRINLRTLPERFAELERSNKRGLTRRDAILAGEPATFTTEIIPSWYSAEAVRARYSTRSWVQPSTALAVSTSKKPTLS